MVSIIPAERTGFDVIGKTIGQGLENHLGPALQRQNERQMNMDALDRAQMEIQQAQGDPYKIAMAFARAGANNPNLQRALGPLTQTALANAQVKRAFGETPGGQPNPQSGGIQNPQPAGIQNPQSGQNPPAMGMQAANAAIQGATAQESPALAPQAQPSTYATPGPFNILTNADMDAESKRYAAALQDPNAYSTRMAQLQAQNQEANIQRGVLEKMASDNHVSPDELGKFMNVGSQFDTRNPSEWLEKTKRKFKDVQRVDKSLERTFIPGVGAGMLGTNREQAIKNLIPDVQKKVQAGLENETREFLANNYLTPTEIEETIHPTTQSQIKNLQKLPKGVFPPATRATWSDVGNALNPFSEKGFKEPYLGANRTPFISYEEAREKAPEHLQEMQNRLASYFLENVDNNTSLLPLRYKLWKEKDYDWRQIGPAIQQAEQMGLKLNDSQRAEMADINTQAPYESLPEIFQSFDRFWMMMRGNK